MALPKLKAPKFKNKKKVVLVTSVTVVAIVAAIAVLYFTNKGFKRKIDELLKRGDKVVDKADNVSFEMPEDRVPPDSEFTIVGKFTDNDGKPVKVKQGLYYVIQNASGDSGPRELLIQGSLGTNVGTFSKTISTAGFPRGDDYDVIVTDSPLNVADIQGQGQQKGPGLGRQGGIPLGIGESEQASKQSMIGGVGGVI
jgi:hypothetical protein